MTDEIFRDGFCDDIFRSMKAQMEPSDDVVASLLLKIAAEAPSSVTENDNVIPFHQSAEIKAEKTEAAAVAALESAPRKHFAGTRTGKKKTNKSIWYYGTAVAASIIVMISTFALLDTNGDDASGVKDLFEQAVGPNTQIVGSDNTGEEDQTPDDGDVSLPSDKEDLTQQDTDGSGQNVNDGLNSDENSSGEGISEGPGNTSGNGSESGNADASHVNSGDNTDSDVYNEKGNNSETDDGKNVPDTSGSEVSSTDSDGSKVIPGNSGTSDIPWTNEIIGNSQVASISISGSNYVVENTVSRSDVGATLETVTITIPQTSTTNAAEVQAKVREVKNVSSEAMVALDVEGFNQPLVYANADYTPSTLGQFVSDLGLEKKISFSTTVRCQNSMVGYSSSSNYSTDIHDAAWTYLLSQSNAGRASYNSFSNGNVKAMFTSESNSTGSRIQFGVSDNGYLYVQMLGTKHTFHIGSENAKGFIEYVTGESLE